MSEREDRRPRYSKSREEELPKGYGRHGPREEVEESARPQEDEFTQRVRDSLHLLYGEWIPDVLITLSTGPEQYTDLLNSIRASPSDADWSGRRHRYLQESVLSRTLRRLEQDELVVRHREDVFPYRVSYQVTPAAEELLVALVPLAKWTERHAGLVKQARQQRRKAQ